MSERYDTTVVGGGPGGYVAAIRAAQLGLRVALVERGDLGGVCLNWGCIPTKALLASAHVLRLARNAGEFGIRVPDAEPDVSEIFRRKDAVVRRLRGGVRKLLEKRGVDVLRGEGRLRPPGGVEVDGPDGARVIESDTVILAVGSRALVPGGFPYDGRLVMTSRDALARASLPGSLLVVGAGAVGCEFAGLYSALGARVVLVEMLPEILPGEDAAAARFLRTRLKKSGIDVRTGAAVETMEVSDDRVVTTLEGGDAIETESALLAMGRRPAVDEAGIAEAGVVVRDGAVGVDDRLQTSLPGVYAIGDLVGGPMLAHVASREGVVAAANVAGRDVRMVYEAVPRCVFTTPEVAGVGLTEEEAKAGGIEIAVGRFPFSASGRALASGESGGFAKILSDAATGRIVGAVIVGPRASELVHEAALAIEAGLGADVLSGMIHAHPTFSEAMAEAAEAVLGLGIHSL